jgi:hypothetical protein
MTELLEPNNTKRLGDIPLTAQLVEQLEDTGVLTARFKKEATAGTLEALDGSLARLFVGASGQVTGFAIEDHVDHETTREIPFDIGTLRLVWLGDAIRITLRTPEDE